MREVLREKGRELGANLGQALRREIPGFSARTLGFDSLSQLLLDTADDLVVVGQQGNDRIWALGESVADEDIEHALAADARLPEVPARDADARVASVELTNFRACRDVKLSLERGITALVGPNGSGKSTLLYGVSYASQVTRGKVRALFSGTRGARRLRTAGATGPMKLVISGTNHVTLSVEATPDDDHATFEVSLRKGKKDPESWRSPGNPPSPPLDTRPECLPFWPSVLLRFRADAVASPSDVVEGEPRLHFDGAGLPTVLAHLATTDPKRLKSIVDQVQAIVPGVEETRQTVRRWDPYAETAADDAASKLKYHLEVRIGGVGWVPADLLSEGMLFAFAIHTVLHQQRPPRILLMDDIDRGLHPKAQRRLIQQLKDITERGGPQVVLTTHSPYVLDELPPESVRVVRGVEGATQVRCITEHPEWNEWSASMTSGEFWTYVGEDWLEQSA